MITNTISNIFWHSGFIDAQARCAIFQQIPLTVWLTGLSGAGKSTLARTVEYLLCQGGHKAYVLDGDNVRHGMCSDLGFTPEDRRENIRRIAETSRLMNDAGLVVISAFISPYENDRQLARQIIGPEKFLEVHVATSLEICEARDPKGIYRKAKKGEIQEFTGISAPYEQPLAPDLRIDTELCTPAECAQQLLHLLQPKIRYCPDTQVLTGSPISRDKNA